MQTNLDFLFKTDEKIETEGLFLEIAEGIGFHVRRFGGKNSPKVKAAYARYAKPYARQIENNTLAEELQRQIEVQVFVESSMVGWKGISIDGQEVEYSKDLAIKLFVKRPELFAVVMQYAADFKNFKEDLGNS